MRPLALTPGEPAGIGPDLVLQLSAQTRTIRWVALADPTALAQRAVQLGLTIDFRAWQPGDEAALDAGVLSVWAVPLAANPQPGTPDPANARASLTALDLAMDGCTRGTFSGIVTGPLQKSVINAAGIPFSGHTEYLAAHTGGTPVMLLVAGTLRVALVTTHLALREVPDAITEARVESTLRILARDLTARFGIATPRIAVLGLNPHAGEAGHFGREEIDVISPVVERVRGDGIAVTGPLPADTAFTPAALARCDAVLAMYHDQGLPVLKHAGFGHSVNCTLGLPLVRTSVDHGTALDLAGTGRADSGSLSAAIELAATMAAKSA
ncbi:MAG: 4-hydroxythreonine-4-phosphate dehydrogenase PdxA [Xanthomonadaceae bacterium]|nr:4-hydroxythreonine-4-phosphate dehydrogenase PdxA [Xanthomonadaceae bacterium]